MKSSNPLINVIVPVYNAELYLEEAIQSVLSQTYQPVEILIINDGSTDGSASVAKKFTEQTIYIFQSNQGAAAARNLGIKKSSADFLAFLDADDVWTPNKLSKQMESFNEHPELDMVFGGVEQFHSPELKMENNSNTISIDKHPLGILPGTMLIKRASFLEVGLFDPNWKVGEFIDWYAKAKEKHLSSTVIPGTVLRRRIHKSNLGIRARDSRADYVQILKAALDRKRKS